MSQPSTQKIKAIKIKSGSKIHKDEFKNIIVKRNGRVISTKGESWISSSNGFIYLYHDKGRIYFIFDKLNQYSDSTITDIGYNKETKTFTFRYEGLCETENGYKKVDEKYEVLFDFENDFNEFVDTIDCFIKKLKVTN